MFPARAFVVAVFAVAACGTAAAQVPPPPPPPPLQALGAPPVPPENPLTEAKINLGKALFWDEQLSRTGTVACGTCHRPMWSGTDPRTALAPEASTNPGPNGGFGDADDVNGSAGVPSHDAGGNYLDGGAAFAFAPQVGARKSPSVVNSAYPPLLFWDGRAVGTFTDPATGAVLVAQGGALENQALAPLVDTAEMGHAGNLVAEVGERLAGVRPLALAQSIPAALAGWLGTRSYPELFDEAFGTPEVTAARIALAIASYERTLVANQTPLDAELSGTPSLTDLERQGRQVFAQAECNACHGGALMSDNAFHYIGVRPVNEDLGRFAQTGLAQHRGAFRTPALRDVAARPPYMHDGSLATLEAVVDFYDRGGDFTAPNKDPRVRPRFLTPQQKAALVAFLRRPLTDARVAAEQAPFDRPTLYTESDRVPVHLGAGVAGSSGSAPRIVALEPPLFGSTNFTVVLAGALGNAPATLVIDASDPGTAAIPADGVQVIEATTDGSGSDDGDVSLQVALTDPALAGKTFHARFYVEDPGAAGGIAVTDAVRFTVFGEAPALFADGFE